MHGRLLRRAALAALLGLGVMIPTRAHGQAPPQVGQAPYGLTTPVVIPPDPTNPNQPRVRLGCWATHTGYGCGSFRSTSVFIFGSCRAFFGEACRKGPASPYPPGYAAGTVGGPPYGAPGYGSPEQKGCNCSW